MPDKKLTAERINSLRRVIENTILSRREVQELFDHVAALEAERRWVPVEEFEPEFLPHRSISKPTLLACFLFGEEDYGVGKFHKGEGWKAHKLWKVTHCCTIPLPAAPDTAQFNEQTKENDHA